jgi:hypothetical protein
MWVLSLRSCWCFFGPLASEYLEYQRMVDGSSVGWGWGFDCLLGRAGRLVREALLSVMLMRFFQGPCRGATWSGSKKR